LFIHFQSELVGGCVCWRLCLLEGGSGGVGYIDIYFVDNSGLFSECIPASINLPMSQIRGSASWVAKLVGLQVIHKSGHILGHLMYWPFAYRTYASWVAPCIRVVGVLKSVSGYQGRSECFGCLLIMSEGRRVGDLQCTVAQADDNRHSASASFVIIGDAR
jgi:hypothetical protein